MKFKIGDLVKIKHVNHDLNGKIGIIAYINTTKRDLHIGFDQPYNLKSASVDNNIINEYFNFYSEEQLTLYRIPNTKIAQKLYKTKIRKVEDEWIYLKEL